MKNELKKTFTYFHFFGYAPTAEELHLFHPVKIAKKSFMKGVERLKRSLFIREYRLKGTTRYTMGEYSISISEVLKKEKNALRKKQKMEWYFRILSLFPQILLLALSGSVAMNQAKKDDDIDLFIIAERKRIWTARIICLVTASMLGLRRKRGVVVAKDKICLNLFIDATDMIIPLDKQTEYVAHEVLQMKPLIDKKNTYARFLEKNRWIGRFFPNADFPIPSRTKYPYSYGLFAGEVLEIILKKLQLFIINRHRTTERVTETQMWFFPDDFEKKLKGKI